jgi:hypothetical protein
MSMIRKYMIMTIKMMVVRRGRALIAHNPERRKIVHSTTLKMGIQIKASMVDMVKITTPMDAQTKGITMKKTIMTCGNFTVTGTDGVSL